MAESGKTAWIFPGQGSQVVGMGLDLYNTFDSVKEIFRQADERLDFPISKMCFEGPEDELRQTINTQPALLTVSYALVKAIEELNNGSFAKPDYVAGHSLGEYTALAVANSIDFPTAVFLARERGRLMQEAGAMTPGAMAAVMGMEEDKLQKVCNNSDTVIANYNNASQLVISGSVDAVAKASQLAQEAGASRVVPLQVSGAFHSPLMKPAQEGLAKIVSSLDFKAPLYPVVANTTYSPITAADQIKTELIDQLCNGVQWQRSVEYMIGQGVTNFVEIGPGKVLCGLIKRIDRKAGTSNVGTVEEIKALFA